MPPEEAERVSEEFGRIARDRIPFSRLENMNLHADGHHVILERSGVPILDVFGHFRGYRGIDRDITGRKKIEERNLCQLNRLTALREIDIAITASHDLHLTLKVIINNVINQLKIDAADILMYKPGPQILEYAAGSGFHTQALQYTRLKIGESYAGRTARDRCMVCVPDLRKTDGFKRSKYMNDENLISYYGVPLIAKGNVIGVLEIFHRRSLEPDQEWLGFLEALAGQAAIAIENGVLITELYRANMDIITAYDATIEGWSKALDLRDKETEGHSQRVTELTSRIAYAIGVNEAEQVHLRRGALLHDIGKMGIPDRILLKPGQLNKEERYIMNKHPDFADAMLSPIEYLRPALDIPYCHHEKMDGTGYPRGLKGEQIPLSARIFAAADIFDALSSERPYRPAWSKEKVLEHIQSLSGNHLDPKVVNIFLANEKDMLSFPLSL
ncbi:MAG: HD domain-containing protein [Nitrospirae bacterium]|nr:HD domain-containing protein [Nitrospirota bacterium]